MESTQSWSSRARALGILTLVAVVTRMFVMLWAGERFPPAADGVYFSELASRLARGLGYTWQAPDGVVTSVAHYPVGYPALIAVFRWVLGTQAWVDALPAIGAALLLVPFAQSVGPRWKWAALVLLIHPALLLYTPARMTEGIAACVLAWILAFAPEGRRMFIVRAMALGMLTLVRPQYVLFAPWFGWNDQHHAPDRPVSCSQRLRRACAVTMIALAVCLPWTLRNCTVMHSCALVSVNGGWNLLIGAQTHTGGWQPLDVPQVCAEVWDEAQKDLCFAREGWALVQRQPLAWLARVPAKMHATFDYFGAAPWYLHASNPAVFTATAKSLWGGIESALHRTMILVGTLAFARKAMHDARSSGSTTRGRVWAALGALGVMASVWPWGGLLAHVCLGVTAWGAQRRSSAGPRHLVQSYLVVLGATALTHAVFFGAGRYGLVLVPWVTALCFVSLADLPFSWNLPVVLAKQAIAVFGLWPEGEESPSSKGYDAG